MTDKERIMSLHRRMEERRHRRERRENGALSAAAAVVTACLLLVIYGGGTAHLGGTAGLYSGSMMMFENAGAYVLVAMLAFMAGVAVTVALLHRRNKSENGTEEKENREDMEKGRNEEDET